MPETVTLPQAKSCITCRHNGTKARCNGCLHIPGSREFAYRHWEEGDSAVDLARLQLAGERTIHIDGEADITIDLSIGKAQRSLFRVGEQCGYFVESVGPSPCHPGHREFVIHTHEGTFAIVYDNRLRFIEIVGRRGRVTVWDRAKLEALVAAA